MAGLSAGAHAQITGSAIPDLDQVEPVFEAAPPAPPLPVESGELVPRLAEPAARGESDPDAPTFIEADRMTGYSERGVELEGHAELRRDGGVIKGDKLSYDQDTDEAFAQGNVRMSRGGALAVGPEARLKVEANEGYMLSPDYYFQQTGGTGKAERIDFLDQNRSSARQASYTTCSPDNADWYFSANRIDLDSDRQVGVAYGGVLNFFGVPVAAAPAFSFPLNDDRRSGFLPPLMGYSSKSGFDLTAPYYVNIAPNRDLTIYPRLMTERGLQLGGEYRYLGETYSGRVRAEFLPDDRKTNSNRWAYSVQHTQRLAPGLAAYLNLNRVSDDRYPDDFNRSVSQSTLRQYTQEGGVTYNWQDFTLLARVQKFQTLRPSEPSYERVPQLNGKYIRYDLGGFDVQMEADYTRFRIPLTSTGFQQPQGERMYFQPSISYPIVRAGWYVTPKVSFSAAQYQMEAATNTPTAQNNLSRAIPTVSLDSGMTFERDAPTISRLFGVNYVQTLEPRLFYVYTPFRDQSQFPLFDTVQSDFGYGQIFSENPFTGNDRIADNNKLTGGVTTRLIESDTGIERFRGTIAQRYDFTGQRVQLNGTLADPKSGSSDLLAATTIQLFRGYYLDAGVQYNPDSDRINYGNVAFTYRPESRKVFNAGYRYRRPTSVTDNTAIDQFELSSQWPITRRAYGIARFAFDLTASQMVDALAGVEYAADCWVGRVVYQRFRNTTQGYTGRVFLQVEFRGLSKIGSNPLNILRLNVPGYEPVSAKPVPTTQFDHYE
ncbi:exported protein required for envelope biosynthesis and integrity (ORGANIC SOLVENT TOLERANCE TRANSMEMBRANE PROTEIN) [Cupriavidus taiwanensis]|uniref:LPS-assembly protein LptD n=2 Tax=Cupriavidus taiwanensis TaxID=164546 RepID=A0A976AYT1_9BURK|nr:exported protein required for envelope biosynthesis and integrity (ORGANIC SOLVENT TOLERANCE TRANSMEMBRANE PROTEIN) [Cupriavidus taiwanensis]SOZ60580.1 exported protein required for envelope biosynthesis and integrity (ORGANIC SOLVENT TOLERANCE TRANSMEMBRANE PROTEIN) [Cupriavidus taiwanensis]SOZ64076.1 exported protein required for envelope biosynthesis and integrity (ORGANIC SOLVENT TOLERANCE TRANSMEMBRANE PROTEIN) [Cupriavidus taiwanensis]SPA06735.1 exported protein required for envelope bi